jgi:hypothetical protein
MPASLVAGAGKKAPPPQYRMGKFIADMLGGFEGRLLPGHGACHHVARVRIGCGGWILPLARRPRTSSSRCRRMDLPALHRPA